MNDRYTSLAASADGCRLVATLASPTRTRWRLPIAPLTHRSLGGGSNLVEHQHGILAPPTRPQLSSISYTFLQPARARVSGKSPMELARSCGMSGSASFERGYNLPELVLIICTLEIQTVFLGGYRFEASLSRSWPARNVITD